jgi:hypothetical protein
MTQFFKTPDDKNVFVKEKNTDIKLKDANGVNIALIEISESEYQTLKTSIAQDIASRKASVVQGVKERSERRLDVLRRLGIF